ncbi:hypothetical protein ZIOFF_010954 [Zingiber officinale]|uniref:GAG-pre-integrase domain-containing protein n=1 Tax=Zingiber officinale TaxID=94328 RepID=A0A8J5M055_ZINOF|nr:hypothetical protein ZIOFF_010954 [Zingiber officinale]
MRSNKINTKKVIFKEGIEDVEVIILQLIEQGQQTSLMLNVTDAIGCSNRMCGEKDTFSNLDESFHSSVKFGDNSTISVIGKGKVTIQAKGDSTDIISNVLFVPDLKTSLLSVGQLQEKGYKIAIKEGVCRIRDAKLGLIAQVNMTASRMFPLYLHTTPHSCFSTKFDDEAWLWHFRYGHLNFSELKTLTQKNMVIGLPQITSPSQVCEECAVSKQHRNQFPQGKSWRAKVALELVHSDICGSITPHSNGDERRKKLYSKCEKCIFLATRPDIMYAISMISRYMDCAIEMHLLAAKRIFRYLQGTKEYGLFYKKEEKSDLLGFTDSESAGDLDGKSWLEI